MNRLYLSRAGWGCVCTEFGTGRRNSISLRWRSFDVIIQTTYTKQPVEYATFVRIMKQPVKYTTFVRIIWRCFMKKGIVILGMCLFVMTCVGCEKKTQNQAAAEDGVVTMRADLTEDDSTTVDCTIFNKTDKDIAIGEEYGLQVLDGKSFVDVPLLPEAGGFNLVSTDISSGEEYSYRAYIEKNFGDLEKGHYRIVKEYTDKDSQKKEDTEKETVSAEFDLP